MHTIAVMSILLPCETASQNVSVAEVVLRMVMNEKARCCRVNTVRFHSRTEVKKLEGRGDRHKWVELPLW